MTELIIINQDTPGALALAGQAANRAAASGVFADYQDRKAANTLRRQEADLALFRSFLKTAGIHTGDLANDPEAWRGMTWGLVAAFQRWQLDQGYSVDTINVHLSSVKVYARLAMQAGTITAETAALIRSVNGYSRKEALRVNEKRTENDIPTRRGYKKAEAVHIPRDLARRLKQQPDTPQGRRDALLMCLLLDHGLRAGEVNILEGNHFDLKSGELRFYRPKVNKEQTHRLTDDTLRAARAYIEGGEAPAIGSIWRTSRKNGQLEGQGMNERTLTERVRSMGEAVGLQGLSCHDCRHYWATQAARNGTDPFSLQEAGGWSSLAMPRRYVEAGLIANAGVNLGL